MDGTQIATALLHLHQLIRFTEDRLYRQTVHAPDLVLLFPGSADGTFTGSSTIIPCLGLSTMSPGPFPNFNVVYRMGAALKG